MAAKKYSLVHVAESSGYSEAQADACARKAFSKYIRIAIPATSKSHNFILLQQLFQQQFLTTPVSFCKKYKADFAILQSFTNFAGHNKTIGRR
ncbi:hypothetical protein [Pontibacter mangrovi]|uniref:Uncharacterized protein n=1 Tax=Pontibacter mangrovi TaxID=2589816 RepID=A0A501WHN5_9BACT|nr:hypothetical protein [Pontibacter mangrovi]TPE45126.1 hypothetical protein FJM65_03530 [Pontibacter mangrovi]